MDSNGVIEYLQKNDLERIALRSGWISTDIPPWTWEIRFYSISIPGDSHSLTSEPTDVANDILNMKKQKWIISELYNNDSCAVLFLTKVQKYGATI